MDEQHIEALLETMTLEEQVALLAGESFWQTPPVPRLGIPAIKVSDGPNGARGGGSLIGGVPAACFPAGVALAASWNTALVEQVGAALGEEALSKGARVLLAPTVNIHRSPLNGRTFECYSEDPHLSARLAVAYIKGVQSCGVSATVKHYIGNESEFQRTSMSSEIDERSLREIYLPPFEAAVKEAATWAVMCSYNKLNGTYTGEHHRLLTDILRGEWAFDGIVMSDWFATRSTAEAVNAGLDLEMPGPPKFRGELLVEAVRAGAASAEAVRASARRVLRLIARVGAFDDPSIPEERLLDRPEQRALIRQAGAEGIVLLKNDGLLPLVPASLTKIAVIGPNATTAQIMGGGSAQVNAPYRISPYDGIAAQVGDAVEIAYEPGCTNYRFLPLLDTAHIATAAGQRGLSAEYFSSPDLSGEVAWRAQVAQGEVMWLGEVGPGVNSRAFSARLSTRFTPARGGSHQLSLVSAGRARLLVDGKLIVDNWDGWRQGEAYFGAGSQEAIGAVELEAGHTYDLTVEYTSPAAGELGIRALRVGAFQPLGDEEIARAVALAADSDVAVLCVGLSGEWDTEGQDRPHMDLVGRQNELIARVAAANPRTVVVLQSGGPLTMPWLNDVAAVLQAWYPGQECGNAIADVLFGALSPSGKLPLTFPLRLEDTPAFINYPGENGKVRYGEGIFVGYRYYDKKRVAPLFPFGFGLAYTSFGYTNLRLSADTLAPEERVTISIDITNSGARPGQEVVQLYVRDTAARVARPEKELKGFTKVALAPGETQTVTLSIGARDLAFYDEAQRAWVAEPGSFELLVAASASDIRARAQLTLVAAFSAPV